jgi:hypothetical protein
MTMPQIIIFAPRYRDKVILIAKWKVSTHNIIKITKSKAYNGEYYLSSSTISKYPLEIIKDKTGVDRLFYAVPVDELKIYENQQAEGGR